MMLIYFVQLQALNQGFDIPNANIGIICGLTSKALSMVQRIGRLN
jgi:superfamily II DNA or RNA helicase